MADRSPWPWLTIAGFGLLIIWSYQGTRVDLGALLGRDGQSQIAAYVTKLFPPDLSMAMVREAGVGAVETFAISFLMETKFGGKTLLKNFVD